MPSWGSIHDTRPAWQSSKNTCEAQCANVTVAYDGACNPTCTVECLVADPVCGADGVTYGCGQADAECHHTTVAYSGPCEPACSTDSDCPQGTVCYLPAPTASERPALRGKCELPDYCQVDRDCDGRPAPSACVAGGWSCLQNVCTYTCGL